MNVSSSQLPLRDKLFGISRDFAETETHMLKFLLKDLLPKTELTADVQVRRVFQCLEERVLIEEFNPQLLIQCLVRIGRENLADKYFPNHDKRMTTDRITSFRLVLFKIATELKRKEKDDLLERFSVPKSTAEDIGTPYELIGYLEERSIIDDKDTSKLQEKLTETGREDLANDLVGFHGGVPLADSQDITQANPSISSSSSSSSFGMETDNMTEGKLTALSAKLLITAAESVGRIGGGTGAIIGTGFRVGSKYIMTASHVVKQALGFKEFTPVTKEEIQHQLDRQGLHIEFTFGENLKPLRLLKIVFYRDCRDRDDSYYLDVAIAELPSGCLLPKNLLYFYDDLGTDTQKKFCFLGHDRGSEDIELGFSWTLIDGLKLEAIKSRLRQNNLLGPSDMKILERCGKDPSRMQFQGPFRQGGSGSPGVVVREGEVRVFTILTHGHFYRPDVPYHLQIQEGTRMLCLKNILKQENIILCEDIFRKCKLVVEERLKRREPPTNWFLPPSITFLFSRQTDEMKQHLFCPPLYMYRAI